jgi:hypothetical protein
MYLNLIHASQHNLRIYLVGKNASGQVWTEIISGFKRTKFKGDYVEFDNSTTAPFYTHKNGQQGYGCHADGCGLHSGNLQYAVLVYNVGGLDIGIAIHRPTLLPFQAQVNLYTTKVNFGNGGLDFHTWLDDGYNPPPGHFSIGEIRDYAMNYAIGTIDELSELGFKIPKNNIYLMGRASSYDSLENWPASNAIDLNSTTSYSSHLFNSEVNDRGSVLSAWLKDGPQVISKVLLTARMFNEVPLGYATKYKIWLTSYDNSRWIDIGNFITPTPAADGTATISFGGSYFTYGIMLQPITLGIDNIAAHYFQLKNLKLGYDSSELLNTTTFYLMNPVNSNDNLENWPASNAIDLNSTTSYSSHLFNSEVNDRGSVLSAWLKDGPQVISKVLLTARMLNGVPIGYATKYKIWLTSNDNSKWIEIGDFYAPTPADNGTATISLGRNYFTYGIMLQPITLGIDSFGAHYFQLADLLLGWR